MAEWLRVVFLLAGVGMAVVAAVTFSILLNNSKRKKMALPNIRADR
jgi:hypothetical protein